jgi:hypothetical protein
MVALQKEAGAAGDPGHGAVRGRAGGAHPPGEHHHQPPEVAHGLQALHRCVRACTAIIFLFHSTPSSLGRKLLVPPAAVRYTTGIGVLATDRGEDRHLSSSRLVIGRYGSVLSADFPGLWCHTDDALGLGRRLYASTCPSSHTQGASM